MASFTIENYLKQIYHLSESENPVQTNLLAESMKTTAASVTDMLKKLSHKNYVNYIKYQGVTLTKEGEKLAISIIRRHRLWEFFLVNKLGFKWDEVHEIAEDLEHIQSEILVDRLEHYLNFPDTDPHGDLIPDKHGHFKLNKCMPLITLQKQQKGIITGVTEHSPIFLQLLEKLNLILGNEIEVTDVIDFDGSVEIIVSRNKINISKEIAKHILIAQE